MIDCKRAGCITCTKRGIPSYKCYLEKQPSVLLQDICHHILVAIGKDNLAVPPRDPGRSCNGLSRSALIPMIWSSIPPVGAEPPLSQPRGCGFAGSTVPTSSSTS